MSIQQYSEKKKPDGKKYNGNHSPVKKTIRTKKDSYCDSLVALVGTLTSAEENVKGLSITYEFKKCGFVKTEKNYRITRNLELLTGVELIQSSAEIKTDVAAVIDKNNKLVDALKAVCAAAKNAKAKFSDLRDAASKLDGCRKDSCNSSQMIKLGCKPAGDCAEGDRRQEATQDQQTPQACENACSILDHLVSVPAIFSQDIDIIYSSSAEIMGIQTFTSITSLQKFQLDFETNAKAFDDLVLQKMKDGKTGVDTAQSDLVDATKALTAASFALYSARNAVESTDTIKDYLCCHKCNCISEDGECGCHQLEDSNDRLKACKCEICEICDEVTGIYCAPSNKQDCAD
ncbi:MAG: hypothetical protein ABIR15_18575 [Chitinophagaceae bacterium]